jgi:hypothetical protein
MRRIWLSLFALACLAFGARGALAQTQPCAQSVAPRIVSASSYLVQTSDRCGWIVLTGAGAVTVQLPAPGLIFAPTFRLTVLPENGGAVTFTNIPDPGTGTSHLVNGRSSVTMTPGQGAVLTIEQDMNWYALPTGVVGAGLVTSITGTAPIVASPSPITATGDISIDVFTETVKGAVPAPNTATGTNFLADTGWGVPSGIGCVAPTGAAGILSNSGVGTCATDTNATLSAGALSLGTSGTPGSVAMGNTTSGTVTVQPVAGALGTATASLPANTGTVAELNLPQSWLAAQRGTPVNVAISTATFTPNFDTGQNFEIDLTSACPCTLANPSTALVAGQAGMIEIHQDGTGSRTIGTWGSDYQSEGGTSSITLSTTASAIDYLSYYVNAAGTGIVLGSIVAGPTH